MKNKFNIIELKGGKIEMEKLKPILQKRNGLVSASLFEREVNGTRGKFLSKSIALNISYLKDDEFQQRSITITKKNLDKVIEVLYGIKAELQ